MSERTVTTVKRILLLASVLVLMLTLCGCRTRITNNDEVSGVVYDEDGYLKDEYDMRRDELSLARAKKPVFTGFGRADEEDEEYYYGDDAETLEEYEPEEFTEEPEDEEEPEPAQNTTVNNAQRSQQPVVNRRRSKNHNSAKPSSKKDTSKKETPQDDPAPTDPSQDDPTPDDPTPVDPTPDDPTQDDQEETVKVILDANGGTCSADHVDIKKGGSYGELPAAEKEGFDFTGWFTEAAEGTPITADTPLISEEEHTIYAQYTETVPEPQVQTFTVTFDLNDADSDVKASFTSGGDPVQVEENGVYPAMPTVVRQGYLFEGWFTDPTGGNRVGEGDQFTAGADQTLYVHWAQEDPYDTWTKKYDEAAGTVKDEEKIDIFIEGDGKDEQEFIKACKGNVIDSTETDKPVYVVKFVEKIDADKANAEISSILADEKYAANPPEKIIIVDRDAVKGDKNTQLAYKYIILNALYDRPDDAALGEALAGLGIEENLYEKVFTEPAE